MILLNCGAGETLKNPLDSKEIKTVNPKGNQPKMYIVRTDAEAKALILWPPDANTGLTGKRPSHWERLKANGGNGSRYRVTDSMAMALSKLQEIVKDREAWRAAVLGVVKIWTWPSNWTITAAESS